MLVGFPDMASSSQTFPPSEPEVNYSQIMEAIATIQGGMSTMQQSISSMQQEVHSINKRVEQNQLDLKEYIK
jgi:predicted  nucleic acid-binding Zn-ribbon protein